MLTLSRFPRPSDSLLAVSRPERGCNFSTFFITNVLPLSHCGANGTRRAACYGEALANATSSATSANSEVKAAAHLLRSRTMRWRFSSRHGAHPMTAPRAHRGRRPAPIWNGRHSMNQATREYSRHSASRRSPVRWRPATTLPQYCCGVRA